MQTVIYSLSVLSQRITDGLYIRIRRQEAKSAPPVLHAVGLVVTTVLCSVYDRMWQTAVTGRDRLLSRLPTHLNNAIVLVVGEATSADIIVQQVPAVVLQRFISELSEREAVLIGVWVEELVAVVDFTQFKIFPRLLHFHAYGRLLQVELVVDFPRAQSIRLLKMLRHWWLSLSITLHIKRYGLG